MKTLLFELSVSSFDKCLLFLEWELEEQVCTNFFGALFLLLARDDFTEDRGVLKGILLLFGSGSCTVARDC